MHQASGAGEGAADAEPAGYQACVELGCRIECNSAMEGRLAAFRLASEIVGPYSQLRVSAKRWGTTDLRMRLLPVEVGTGAEVGGTRMYCTEQVRC